MSDRAGRLFETLEPPRGGLAGLRARLEREGVRRRRIRAVQLAGALAAVPAIVIVLLLWPAHRPAPDPLQDELRGARLRLGLLPRPSEVLTVAPDRRASAAVRRVPLDTERVLFFWVSSIDH